MPHTRERERKKGIEVCLDVTKYTCMQCTLLHVRLGREGKLAFDIMIGLLRYNCTILRVVYFATVEIETCQG